MVSVNPLYMVVSIPSAAPLVKRLFTLLTQPHFVTSQSPPCRASDKSSESPALSRRAPPRQAVPCRAKPSLRQIESIPCLVVPRHA